MNQEVKKWIEDHKDELIEDVKALCSIPSVNAPAAGDKPFGEEPYKALMKAMEIAKSYGFTTKNYDNYVAAADFDPVLPHALDILGHTDVVPAGEGWTVTEPFKIIEKDGRLYGRGTSDDKGPLLASMFALKAIKELGIPLKKGVRVIIGSDEETGSTDIAHYFETEKPASMTFSPDAEFPIINTEKGQFRGKLSADFTEDTETPRVLSLEAGVALNAVPQKAVIRFEGLDREAAEPVMAEVAKECNVEISFTADQEITVIGESAHASTPESGRNAGLAAVILISRLPLHESEELKLVKKIPVLFPYGVTDGSGIGIKLHDEESHDLSCTLDLYHIDPSHMEFSFDARTPVSATKENCEERAAAAVTATGFAWSTPGMVPPHVVSADSDFVKTLLSAYTDVTGLPGECMAIGGGTYVHDIENGVAFGAVLPGVDTRMHGADEFIDISNLVTAAEVYAEAILRLCG